MPALTSGPLALRGRVLLRVLNTDGVCVQRMESRNSLTYIAPLVMKDLLAQPVSIISHPADTNRGFASSIPSIIDPAKNKLGFLWVGTGSAPSARNFTELDTEVGLGVGGMVALTSVVFPTNAELQVTATFGTGDANVSPSYITEVGLYTYGSTGDPTAADADRRIFARQLHGGVQKDASLILEYTWTILFS